MPDPTDQAEPAPRRTRRPSPLVIGTLIVVCGAAAVVYGMVPLGKKAQACPGGDAAVTRLDPLVHGEIAALSLAKPARLAPDLAFTGSDGKPLRLADFKGRTVLLNLWATWCVPCRQEMPALDKLQAKLGGADFEVVAVNVDTARLDRPKVFLKDAGVSNLAFYADPTADVLQQLKADGELLGLPTSLLIDRNGCQLGTIAGGADWASPEAEHLIGMAKS